MLKAKVVIPDEACWHSGLYKSWKFPRPIPGSLLSHFEFAKTVKEHYPVLWRRGGKTYANTAFAMLSNIIERGFFSANDRPFIKRWQGWMSKNKKATNLSGVIANLKWLGIVELGSDYMRKVILDAALEIPKK